MRKVTAQLGKTLLRQCQVHVIESITEVYRSTEKFLLCLRFSRLRADQGATQGPESPWAGARACRYRPFSGLMPAVARRPAITSCAARRVA